MFLVVNVISFSPLDQQLLRFSPLLDHVTEITCHLFRSVQFDFGNLRSGLIETTAIIFYWGSVIFYWERLLKIGGISYFSQIKRVFQIKKGITYIFLQK